MIFFLPNMTWLQPPAHIHAMIAASWADATVDAQPLTNQPQTLRLAAQLTSRNGGRQLVVRAVNSALSSQSVELQLTSATLDGSGCAATLLHGESPEDVNPPANVSKVAPYQVPLTCEPLGTTLRITLPALSFAVLTAGLTPA